MWSVRDIMLCKNRKVFGSIQGYLTFISCLCAHVLALQQHGPACMLASTAFIACWNVHVAWNDQVKMAQAWGWAACCCALLCTICLCQKYLLCAEWGMKSIQVLFSQLLLLEGSRILLKLARSAYIVKYNNWPQVTVLQKGHLVSSVWWLF